MSVESLTPQRCVSSLDLDPDPEHRAAALGDVIGAPCPAGILRIVHDGYRPPHASPRTRHIPGLVPDQIPAAIWTRGQGHIPPRAGDRPHVEIEPVIIRRLAFDLHTVVTHRRVLLPLSIASCVPRLNR